MRRITLIAAVAAVLSAQITDGQRKDYADRKKDLAAAEARIAKYELELGRERSLVEQHRATLALMRTQWTKACADQGKKLVEEPEPNCR